MMNNNNRNSSSQPLGFGSESEASSSCDVATRMMTSPAVQESTHPITTTNNNSNINNNNNINMDTTRVLPEINNRQEQALHVATTDDIDNDDDYGEDDTHHQVVSAAAAASADAATQEEEEATITSITPRALADQVSMVRQQVHAVAVQAAQLEALMTQTHQTMQLLEQAHQTGIALEHVEEAALAAAQALIALVEKQQRTRKKKKKPSSSSWRTCTATTLSSSLPSSSSSSVVPPPPGEEGTPSLPATTTTTTTTPKPLAALAEHEEMTARVTLEQLSFFHHPHNMIMPDQPIRNRTRAATAPFPSSSSSLLANSNNTSASPLPRTRTSTADGVLVVPGGASAYVSRRTRTNSVDIPLFQQSMAQPPSPQQQPQQQLPPTHIPREYARSTSWAYPLPSSHFNVENGENTATATATMRISTSCSTISEQNAVVSPVVEAKARSRTERSPSSLSTSSSSSGGGEPTMMLTANSFLIRANDLNLPPVMLSCVSGQDQQAAKTVFPDNRLDGLYPLVESVVGGGQKEEGGSGEGRRCTISLTLLDRLFDVGLATATDDGDTSFQPIWETQRMISQGKCCSCIMEPTPDWPFAPWFEPSSNEDVLVWTQINNNKKKDVVFGSDWPMVKARARVKTSAKLLMEFLLDSTQVKKYNKMCLGREDVGILLSSSSRNKEEDNVDDNKITTPTTIHVTKIMRAVNKPKMSPKSFEMLSLCHAKSLPQNPEAYMIVHRSVWETAARIRNGTATNASNNNHLTRSEMVLGVHLIRPVVTNTTMGDSSCGCCELTLVTHVVTPNVPELLAKRAAPNSAATLVREIQALFLQQQQQ